MRLLKLCGEVGDAEIAAVCEAWDFAFALRAAYAGDARRERRFNRLLSGVAEARRVLLGEASGLADCDGPPQPPVADRSVRRAPSNADWLGQRGLVSGAIVDGRFELGTLRGVCGLGCVFDAWDRVQHLPITLEVLAPAPFDYPAARERYLTAARAVQQLGQAPPAGDEACRSAFARVYGVFDCDGMTVVSIERLPRQTLREQMSLRRRKRRSFSPGEVRSVTARLGAALAYAGANGIQLAPRPEHVWLRDDGALTILHFGICSALSDARSPVPASTYATPESLQSPATLNDAGLQYMLGVLAYELLLGEMPRTDDALSRCGAPEGMRGAIARAQSRRPADRFSSVAEFVRALAGDAAPPGDEPRIASQVAARGRRPAPTPRPQPGPLHGTAAPRRRSLRAARPTWRGVMQWSLACAAALIPLHAHGPAALRLSDVHSATGDGVVGTWRWQRAAADALGARLMAVAGHEDDEPFASGTVNSTDRVSLVEAVVPTALPVVPDGDATEEAANPESGEADDSSSADVTVPMADDGRPPEPNTRFAEPTPQSERVLPDPMTTAPRTSLELTVAAHDVRVLPLTAGVPRVLSRGVFPMTPEEAALVQRAEADRRGLAVRDSCGGALAALPLVLIPAGEFTMGSPEYERGRFDDEGPLHATAIPAPFFMSRTEITEGQWRSVMGSGPAGESDIDRNESESIADDGTADLPVVNIAWSDARLFCERLAELSGRSVRLPTEVEWEYACRAGRATPYFVGEALATTLAAFDVDGSIALLAINDGEARIPVGSFPPNAWGVQDMHGGVWEWCADAYEPYRPIGGGHVRKPARHSETDAPRVLRGGSWATSAAYCRSAARARLAPGARRPDVGFRIVVEVERAVADPDDDPAAAGGDSDARLQPE